jgi:TonB family protein
LTAGVVPDTVVLHPLRVGGDVQPPVAIERFEPALPKELAVAGLVVLEAVIDKRGVVRDVRVIRDAGEPAAGAAYAASMKKWRFRPATLHGQPVDVTYNFTVNIDVR